MINERRQKHEREKKARGKTLFFSLAEKLDKVNREKNVLPVFEQFLDGAKKGVSIALGYIPVGIAFGLLAKTSGFTIFEAFLFSFVFYSGAAQFMCVDLLLSGISPLTIMVSVFLLNSRLMIMSMTLGLHIKKISKPYIPLIGAMITDETFSILYFNKERMTTAFALGVESVAYWSWGLATLCGFFVGQIIPVAVRNSLEVGLTCLFVSLLIPSMKKERKSLFVCGLAALVYGIIFYTKWVPSGWDIIVGILISSFLSVMVLKRIERKKA